jgi:hypothetical protein
MEESILERNHRNVWLFKTLSQYSNLWIHQIIHTGKKPYNVRTVTNPSVTTQPSETIREFTLERNHTNVRTMTNPSVIAHTSETIREPYKLRETIQM